ncbi:CopD family protein (plasmid) [Marivivens sp. LCG002]|uniref:copper resistance D family protein n=1 Tax=Marivivens sp. LCG002 TaxID=3051171 RepID=UPI002552AA11|nr:CopD family protein [Marivivens sp. LCG002]WIV52345.1 CopD family protein [Marivivens sp. LCG002]
MIDVWEFAAIITKLALYGGVLCGTGLIMVSVCYPQEVTSVRNRLRWGIAISSLLLIVASAFSYLLRAAALTGGVDGMVDPEMLGLLWQTPVADVLDYRSSAAAIMLLGLAIPMIGHWVSLCAGIVALWSFAQIGHVQTLDQTWVRTLHLLHLLGVAFWIGVLLPLHDLATSNGRLADAARLGDRFGVAASVIVPLLLVAGGILAWLLVGDFGTLLQSAYGRTILVKIGLVGLVLLLAAANKLRFVPAMMAGNAQAAGHLAKSIRIEALLILATLAATATLTSVVTLPE